MRLYTSSYDGRSFVLEDEGDAYAVRTERAFDDQTTDVFPDRSGGLLVAHRNHGVHRYADDTHWTYTGIKGSIRGLTTDIYGNFYTGTWNADQGFHKFVETPDGVANEWVYRWDGDDGMITAKPDHRGRLALALKTNEVHLIEERDGSPEAVWTWSPWTGEIMREVCWGMRGNLYVGSEDGTLYELSADGELLDSIDLGFSIFGASLTRHGDIYVATSSGVVLVSRTDRGLEHQWTYLHVEEGMPQLVHQVAAHPDGDHFYSCCYDENTVHKVDPNGGSPRLVWSFDGHTDNVREVRIPTEYAGVHPEVYGHVADARTWETPAEWQALREGGAVRTGEGVRLGYSESYPPLDVPLGYYLPCTEDPPSVTVEVTSGILGAGAYEFRHGSIEQTHSLDPRNRSFFAWIEPYRASGEVVTTYPDFDVTLRLDGDLLLDVGGKTVATEIDVGEFSSVGYTVEDGLARLFVNGQLRESMLTGSTNADVAGDRFGARYEGKLCHAVATRTPQEHEWFERMHDVTTGQLSTYPIRT